MRRRRPRSLTRSPQQSSLSHNQPPPNNNNHQGPELTSFAEFTADFPPDLKGLAIGNSDVIRAQHNAFARPDPLLQDERRKKEDDEGEAFHFVAYVPRGGKLWELDGLREGPIPLCEATDADWLDKVRRHFLFLFLGCRFRSVAAPHVSR